MNTPFDLFRLQSAPTQRDGERARTVAASDVQWGRPVFRAPALATNRQVRSELPFFANFRSKFGPQAPAR